MLAGHASTRRIYEELPGSAAFFRKADGAPRAPDPGRAAARVLLWSGRWFSKGPPAWRKWPFLFVHAIVGSAPLPTIPNPFILGCNADVMNHLAPPDML